MPITVDSRCANFREEGKPLYPEKNTHSAERSTIDTQLAHERTTSDLVSVVTGTIVRSLSCKNWQDRDKVSISFSATPKDN